MKIIRKSIHPKVDPLESKSTFQRKAARAIVLNGDEILLLYTKKYDDYSLPGGGVDKGEDIIKGLIRELEEETGAQNIRDISEFGIYEEFRPWYKPDFDIIHMISYCYTCSVDYELGETNYEHYEVSNGMNPVWINLDKAIAHNEKVMKTSDKKGMSIDRETYILNLVKDINSV